jgi:hypothetical protein
MSKKSIGSQTNFSGGIAISKKQGIPNSFAFGLNIDHRSDPTSVRINPKSENISNNQVKDLILWGQRACDRLYFYDQSGNIYLRESDTTSLVHTAANSSGNGLIYFGEEDALYYAQDKTLGRLSNPCTEDNFIDDYLASEGGDPTNQASLILEADSSQYLNKTDTTSLSLTGDLSFEAYIKPESLPSGDEEQIILSKWNENGNKRSYRFGIGTADDFFGDGSDGDITISSNTEWDPIDSTCSGTAGTKTLSATNSSFSAGQQILIIQNRGNISGYYELNEIKSYTAGTITTVKPLQLTYSSGDYLQSGNAVRTQVIVIPQYNNVTVNSGATWSCKDWNGTVGGVMVWKAKGTVTINGTINASHKGFRGGAMNTLTEMDPECQCHSDDFCPGAGQSGEDQKITNRPTTYDASNAFANQYYNGFHVRLVDEGNPYPFCTVSDVVPPIGGGGGGGAGSRHDDVGAGGAGGSYGTKGENAPDPINPDLNGYGGNSGSTYGDAQLSRVHLGAGGGGGGKGRGTKSLSALYAGDGGGALMLFGNNFTGTGAITSDGQDGADVPPYHDRGGCGGGAGGSILIKMNTGDFSDINVTYNGGSGGDGAPADPEYNTRGGDGGRGRSHVDYGTSFTGGGWGETSTKDSSLADADNLILFLDISDDGTSFERYSVDISDQIETGVWKRWGVVWDASTSSAEFFKNGISLGTRTGSNTSIDDNNSDFLVGASLDGSASPENFYDGKIDDVRVWSDKRTDSEMVNNNDKILNGEENNLVAYYKFDETLVDSQASANNNLSANSSGGSVDLILQEDDSSKILQEDSIGSITQETDAQLDFSDDVPFYGITDRNDLDLSNDVTGDTYTLLTIINEEADQKIEITPTKDPQKSLILDIDTVGTGDWTITIHDASNNTVASLTVENEELYTGLYEFIFDDVWRPTIGRTYHIHVTSSVSDAAIVSSVNDDLSTARYFLYYQFLIDDAYHPMTQMLNFIVIGNERYVGKLEGGGIFEPNHIILPSSYRVRCFAKWREYLAIGVTRGDAITDYDEGYIFFWDGTSDTYNFFVKVPEGGINALFTRKNTLYAIAGYQGKILAYNGGEGASIVHKIPGVDLDETLEIAPGAMTMWRGNIIIGGSLDTDSEEVYKGAYTYGKLNTSYPMSLGFEYSTSLGTQTDSDIKVGMVHPFGSELYMSWGQVGGYGLDKISITNDCFEEASLELLMTDSDLISDDKKVGLVIRAEFEELTSGQSVKLKYKKNRDENWTILTEQNGLGQTSARETLRGRLKELQFGVDLESEQGDPIILTGLTLEMAADRGRHA